MTNDERQDSRAEKALSAEMAVIGSLCVDPEPVAPIVFHRLRPEDFGNAVYRNIFRAGRDLWLERRPLDAVTIAAALGNAHDQVIAEAMQMTPTAANVEGYAEIVIEEGKLRKLRDIGMKLSLHLEDLAEGQKLLAEAEAVFARQGEERVYSYREMLNRFLDRQNDTKPLDYIDWGIEKINQAVQISSGRFVVLGAPSSVGKTAFALQLAYNIARSGKRVGFFSYETSEEDAGNRTIANTSGTAMNKIKTKSLNALDYEAIFKEADENGAVPFTLEDSGDWTIDELRARTLAMQYEVIFIDYVQMIPGDPRKPRWEIVTDTSITLHRMAQKTGVTVIALSQITAPEKDSKGKRRALTKEDLRESQQLANDAEAVILMDLTVQGDYGSEREVRIAKNKDGGLGRFWMKFEPQFMRFTPCDKPEHVKKREYHDQMTQLRKERKQKKEDDATQMGFDELPTGKGDDLPF